jgi:hypothetical protein
VKVRVHKLLIFAISSIVVHNQPRDTLVYHWRHVHVSKGIDEWSPWNFLQEFRRKIRNEGGKVLKRLDRCETIRGRTFSGVNSFDGSAALACTNNCLDIRKSFRSSDGLQGQSRQDVHTSAVALGSRLGRFRRVTWSCGRCLPLSARRWTRP